VTREGEAIAVAAGLWLGGAAPVVVLQNTGLLEAGDALRGTASRMGAPLLVLVTCRGYPKARATGLEPGQVELNRDVLVRPDLDSVAPMTEGTLRAWGIPFLHWRHAGELTPVERALALARHQERPVALLVEDELA
jgi:sulfopyruvate decarboxylase TPP-binding subunit